MRISAFIALDDKKPLQKSIVGFLQPGQTDCCNSSQGMHQNLKEEHLSNHSIQAQPLTNIPQSQKCQKHEEFPWRSKQKLSEAGQEPQLSFFQRAHAKRLQLMAENANTKEEGQGKDTSVITPISTSANNVVESSTKAATNNCTASDLQENVSPAQASTSGCGRTGPEALTCPVCFRKVETTDLNIFNRHIDQCLSDTPGKPNQSTVSEKDSDVDLADDHKQHEAVEKWIGEGRVKEFKNSEELSRDALQEAQHSLKNNYIPKVLLIKGDHKTMTSEQHQSCKGPVLTCPVCQLIQDTDDLTVFNHHVDLCLNKEVIHELRGEMTLSRNASPIKNSKTLGKCVFFISSLNLH